jgi:hypothetical protein
MALFKDFDKKRKFSIAPVKLPNPPKKNLEKQEIKDEDAINEKKEQQLNTNLDVKEKEKEVKECANQEKPNETKEIKDKHESSNDEDIDLI